MRISDWSSDVGSSDLSVAEGHGQPVFGGASRIAHDIVVGLDRVGPVIFVEHVLTPEAGPPALIGRGDARAEIDQRAGVDLVILALHRGHGEHADRLALARSEEHTSEIQSLMSIPDAVFCLYKNTNNTPQVITSYDNILNHHTY